jgi:hypothetical protein
MVPEIKAPAPWRDGSQHGASQAAGRDIDQTQPTTEEPMTMADLEQVEIQRYRRELSHDVHHLVKKYCRIMSWEVPELDEAAAGKLIFKALREALNEVEQEAD